MKSNCELSLLPRVRPCNASPCLVEQCCWSRRFRERPTHCLYSYAPELPCAKMGSTGSCSQPRRPSSTPSTTPGRLTATSRTTRTSTTSSRLDVAEPASTMGAMLPSDRGITLAEHYAAGEDQGARRELVDGVLIVSPYASRRHALAAQRLSQLLDGACPPG